MQRGNLWVFGYGSLMWKPGFEYLERRTARLDGFQRRFALTSRHYRGTPEKPGLVLGLDWAPGRSCTGVAFRVAGDAEREIRDYVGERLAEFKMPKKVVILEEIPKGPTGKIQRIGLAAKLGLG